MTTKEHLLTILGEEGAEITKCASKILRFGIKNVNIERPEEPDNREKLIDELNDLLGVAQMLVDIDVLPPDWRSMKKQTAKQEKVSKFLQYSDKHGLLTPAKK